jgi:hypothetical protein
MWLFSVLRIPEMVPRNFRAAVIVIPGVRIGAVIAVLAVGPLVLAGCGSADRVVAPRGVHRQAARARAELREAGWKVTLVLPGHGTRICGDGRVAVRMSVSAVEPRVPAAAPIGHPHLTAWLFPHPREASECLSRFLAAGGDASGSETATVHVLHTPTEVQVVARAGRYFVIASGDGPLGPLRRAAERAFARL